MGLKEEERVIIRQLFDRDGLDHEKSLEDFRAQYPQVSTPDFYNYWRIYRNNQEAKTNLDSTRTPRRPLVDRKKYRYCGDPGLIG